MLRMVPNGVVLFKGCLAPEVRTIGYNQKSRIMLLPWPRDVLSLLWREVSHRARFQCVLVDE
jgi:hypothetical protein